LFPSAEKLRAFGNPVPSTMLLIPATSCGLTALHWWVQGQSQNRATGIVGDAFTQQELDLLAARKQKIGVHPRYIFPYLVWEVKRDTTDVELSGAREQSMHAICFAVRDVLSLATEAKCMDECGRQGEHLSASAVQV
ncbi:hypothetical protein KEM55_004516, partial [Ascosphaera atra]